MVDVGTIIRAKVTRVEPYGVYLEHAQGPVIVLVPEVSWADARPLRERIQLETEHDVLVLRYNYRDKIIVGSIRRLDQEHNPYRQLALLEPGTVVTGRVVHLANDTVTVELPNGAWGHVPKKHDSDGLKRDDELKLTISSVEVDEGRLYLQQVGPDARPANGSTMRHPAATKV